MRTVKEYNYPGASPDLLRQVMAQIEGRRATVVVIVYFNCGGPRAMKVREVK